MDQSIQSTCDDAIRAKDAAVRTGYYEDPFVSVMMCTTGMRQQRRSSGGAGPHQVQPIIKRGTHARVACMDKALQAFLNLNHRHRHHHNHQLQVVVLGSGKDTSFFRLQAGMLLEQQGKDGTLSSSTSPVHWFEIDHPNIVEEKADIIENNTQLFGAATKKVQQQKPKQQQQHCCNIQFQQQQPKSHDDDNNHEYPWKRPGSTLNLIGHDLRQDNELLLEKLRNSGYNNKSPTLFMLECVLMYLPDETTSRSLLTSICSSNFCSYPYLVLYEPILGNDPFGKVMERNLCNAGVTDTSFCLVRTRTIQQQLQKLLDAGFTTATGCDMSTAYETIVSTKQRQNAAKCEFLDEYEEWILIMKHYCFIVATAGGTGGDGNSSTSTTSTETMMVEQFCDVGKSSPVGFVQGRCESVRK